MNPSTVITTGKRRGRKRKSETPITLPEIGETDNLRISNVITPEYCNTPMVFGDIMIFSKKDDVRKKPIQAIPLLPLLNSNKHVNSNNNGNNINYDESSTSSSTRSTSNNFLRHTYPPLPPLPTLPTSQSGLGSNINFKKVIEKGVGPKTSAACWWCCHAFDWHPLSLPVYHDEKRSKYKVAGNFCSWNCMKAFNNVSNSVNKFRIHQMIHNMFRKIVLNASGKPFPYKHIPLAPSRWTLKLFGGEKTIEEFRGDCVLLNSAGAVRLERSTILCVQPIVPARNYNQ